MRPIRNNAEAMVAPVFPAEIMALAAPSRTASALRTNVESFLRRTPPAASSSIAMISLATMWGIPEISSAVSDARLSGPTRAQGMPAAIASKTP